MIAYDLWEGTEGALPQIQEALTSEEVKAKIRDEIAVAIKDDLPDQAALIALETAVSLVEQWQGFCTAYADVCALADKDENFQSLLGLVALDELDELAALVGWFQNQAGQEALLAAAADGTLETLLALPTPTLTTLVAESRPATALAWLDLAGAQMPQVVALGLHRLATPGEFDAATLAALLALDDEDAIRRLVALAPVQRNALLALPPVRLQQLLAASSTGAVGSCGLGHPGTRLQQPTAHRRQRQALRVRARHAASRQCKAATAYNRNRSDHARPVLNARHNPVPPQRQEYQACSQTARNDTIATPILLAIILLLGAGGVAVYVYWRRRQGG